MAKRKWIGTLTKNIVNLGDAKAGKEYTFKKGQRIVVWKKRDWDEYNTWNGKYQYHYSLENGRGLVRMKQFLLEEFDEPNLKE